MEMISHVILRDSSVISYSLSSGIIRSNTFGNPGRARVQLYGACPKGYAARAISSIDTENFHGMLHRLEEIK